MPEENNTPRVYTEQEVRERFVSKDVIRERTEEKNGIIKGLQSQITDYQKQILEAQPRLAQLEALSEQVAARDKAIQAAEDRVALARAGIGDDGAVGFLRMAFDQHVAALEEKPEDLAGAFRSWVGSEEGARSNPYVGHLFGGATAAPVTEAPAAKAPGLPPVNRAQVTAPVKAGQPLTPAQVQAEIGRIRGLPREEARAALSALRERQTGGR